MVLILDLFEYVALYEAGGKIGEEGMIDILIQLYEDLYIIPDDILELIDEIIIVNYLIEFVQYSPRIYHKFLKRINKRSYKAKYLYSLLKDIGIKSNLVEK